MANFVFLAGLSLLITSTTSIIVPHYPRPTSLPLYRFQQSQNYYSKPLDRVDEEKSRHSYGNRFNNRFDHQDYENGLILPEEHQPIHDFAEPPVNNLDEDDDNLDGRFAQYHGQHQHQHHYVQSVPISEHVEVSRPVAVPVYKEIGIPVPHPVKIGVPHPIPIRIPQPYPVSVPVSYPVPIHVVRTVPVPVEKKVPYPVEKHVPVPIEKPVPITIEKHIPVPVYKPYPVKVPVYKTIYHHGKPYHGR